MEKIGEIEFGQSSLLKCIDYIIDKFNQHKIKINPTNRLYKAQILFKKIINEKIEITQKDDLLIHQINDAQWTVIEQYIIALVHKQTDSELSSSHRQKLELMTSGSESEATDKNPLARNTQFELFVAAWLTMGGIPVKIMEPDLRIDYLGLECGVAVKRVRSNSQIIKRTMEAADQLNSSNLSGFIAINIDVLLKIAPGLPGPDKTLEERLNIIKEVNYLLKQNRQVLGRLIFGHDCIWDFNEARPMPKLYNYFDVKIFPKTETEERRGEEFFSTAKEQIGIRMNKL